MPLKANARAPWGTPRTAQSPSLLAHPTPPLCDPAEFAQASASSTKEIDKVLKDLQTCHDDKKISDKEFSETQDDLVRRSLNHEDERSPR